LLFIPEDQKNFDKEKLKIYTQNGFVIENFQQKKLDLPEYFTLQRNGGIKTIISIEEDKIALISGSENNCFFAGINSSGKWK
jgi:hypothetical protein